MVHKEKKIKRAIYKSVSSILVTILAFVVVFSIQAIAAETDENRYYIGDVVNTGKDNGYSESNEIDKKDPHFGWSIGSFYINGYTRVTDGNTDNPVFLKNVGDTVTLWFKLEQDITCLNGNEDLFIYSDENGYDEIFDIPKSNFGKGTLIIRHTDYQNNVGEPIIYRDYLAANASLNADTKVKLCEEGDYEVSLLYEIKDNGFAFFDSYKNYRISFKFSVRNGNAMVFPFDVTTRQELTNSAFTENGFYLDLAKSRYLHIDIKKEVLKSGADGLVEDTRFNRPAKDGEQYTEEGIYTITVTNQYTKQTTEKKIYVGTNSVLKAHVVTGLSIREIETQIANGAIIATDGTIIKSDVTQVTTMPEYKENIDAERSTVSEVKDTTTILKTDKINELREIISDNWLILVVVCGVVLIVLLVLILKKKKSRKN